MRRVLLSLAAVVAIVLIPVGVFLLRPGADGRVLRATVGRCSFAQRVQQPAACFFIDDHPTIEVVGPIDETGTPFARTLHRADGQRRLRVELDSGRYDVYLEIDHDAVVRTSVAAGLDLSSGSQDVGVIRPTAPLQLAAASS